MKPRINGIVIVEGTNDASFINSLIDVEVVTLNGCELQNMKYLKKASESSKLFLLTDPDNEGRKIRERVNKEITNLINIEIDINKCTKGDKNGVAECENNEVLRVLSPYFEEINIHDENNIGIIFKTNERKIICEKLNIEEVNNKQLNKRLRRLNISKDEIIKLLED